MVEKSNKTINQQFLELLLRGDRKECSKLAHDFYDNHKSLHDLYENVFKEALYKVGELWEHNKISVATEHLASAIVESILNEFYAEISFTKKHNKKVLVTCVEDELHQIGIKMISDIFELNGWNSYFLGANTPTQQLIIFMKNNKPDMLAISLSIYFRLPKLEEMLQNIRKELPDLPILVGGQAFRIGGQEVIQKYDNIAFQPDLQSMELYINKL